jgi:hypothetical protein
MLGMSAGTISRLLGNLAADDSLSVAPGASAAGFATVGLVKGCSVRGFET